MLADTLSLFFFSLFVSLPFSSAQTPGLNSNAFQDCSTDSGNDAIKVSLLRIDPWPPIHGQLMRFHIAGSITQDVSQDAEATVEIKQGDQTIFSKNLTCADAIHACELKAGEHFDVSSSSLAHAIPSALQDKDLTVKFSGSNGYGRELICLRAHVRILSQAFDNRGHGRHHPLNADPLRRQPHLPLYGIPARRSSPHFPRTPCQRIQTLEYSPFGGDGEFHDGELGDLPTVGRRCNWPARPVIARPGFIGFPDNQRGMGGGEPQGDGFRPISTRTAAAFSSSTTNDLQPITETASALSVPTSDASPESTQSAT